MRPDPVLQFRLGLAAIGLILLVALAAAFAPRLLDRRREAEAVFGNVAGLAEGAAVIDRGFIVGRVTRIEQRLTERRFIVYLRLDPDWQPSDPKALGLVVEEPNPLRPATLSVVSGFSSIDCPEPAPLDPAITGMQLRGCGHHLSMVELTLLTLNSTKDTVLHVNSILEAIAPTGKKPGAPADTSALMVRINATLKNVQEMSEKANALLDKKHQQQINGIIDNLALTSRRASATAKDVSGLIRTNAKPVGSSIADLRYILAVTAAQMASITTDLQASTANLREITSQLRDDPSSVIRRKDLGDPAIAGKRR